LPTNAGHHVSTSSNIKPRQLLMQNISSQCMHDACTTWWVKATRKQSSISFLSFWVLNVDVLLTTSC